MPVNTDEKAQRMRRRGAWKSAVVATIVLLAEAFLLLHLRQRFLPEGIWRGALLVISLLYMGAVFPIWIVLNARLKEIQGGEENAAVKY